MLDTIAILKTAAHRPGHYLYIMLNDKRYWSGLSGTSFNIRVEFGSLLDQLPPSLIVYANEGENFSIGVGLSSKAREAARKVIEQVSCEVQDVFKQLWTEFTLENEIFR